ncbi:MAG: DUF2149 domain-containing protein [Spongiibacteraceae bacterium]
MSRRWHGGRFDSGDDEPLGPLANLLDLMLVFACGLIAALIAMSEQLQDHFQAENNPEQVIERQIIERGRELPQIPGKGVSGGDGFESVGQVYRDSKTGKLILISE